MSWLRVSGTSFSVTTDLASKWFEGSSSTFINSTDVGWQQAVPVPVHRGAAAGVVDEEEPQRGPVIVVGRVEPAARDDGRALRVHDATYLRSVVAGQAAGTWVSWPSRNSASCPGEG